MPEKNESILYKYKNEIALVLVLAVCYRWTYNAGFKAGLNTGLIYRFVKSA